MVITYATKAEIKLPMGPLDRLSGAALGTQKDYMSTTGLELVKGIEPALAELKKVSNPRQGPASSPTVTTATPTPRRSRSSS